MPRTPSDPAPGADPYRGYAALRQRCPVQAVPSAAGGFPGHLVTGHAEARQALLDPALSKDTAAFFADRPSGRRIHPVLAQSMLATDPPAHTRLRQLVAGAFSSGTVDRLRPYIHQLAEQLVDAFDPAGTDLVEALAAPLPVTVIGELLGVPEADRGHLRDLSGRLFAAGRPQTVDDASHALAEYLDALVTAKRTTPGDDLLSRLLEARDGGGSPLTQFELTSLASLLLVAGHETSTNAIGNAVLALLQNPDALARLRQDPGLVEGAVDELLRYDSAVALATFRWTQRPTRLGGQDLDAGRPVLVSLGAANRDPLAFADPDRLDLDRDARAQLAFGHGIHRCLGAPLARAELAIAVSTLLRRHPDVALAVPAEQLRWRETRLMRGLVALPVTL
ncbi:cytochrome P450 [Streptacidiphilus sp. N1-12]|uniref:Cytochrome P450 n=2 Tax=Streptacidiphilus alkalitolerans TaxID=3342712 RepID=A0ABV6VMM8_9ACTN